MRNREKKATAIRFHDGLQQLRKDGGGMDIGAREIWVDVGMENDSEPVRRFETFTADLMRIARGGTAIAQYNVARMACSVMFAPPAKEGPTDSTLSLAFSEP